MEFLNKLWSYITFKKDKEAKGNSYLTMMHGMNKLSILMFLLAIVLMIYKCNK